MKRVSKYHPRTSWRVGSVVLKLVWTALFTVLVGTAEFGTMLPCTVFRFQYTYWWDELAICIGADLSAAAH